MNLSVGIVAESEADIKDFLTLCNKILEVKENRVRARLENRFSKNTKIRQKDLKNLKEYYLARKKPPKVIIIFTDKDNDKNVESELIRAASDLSIQQKVLCVVPDRNFESWIIMDIKIINLIFDANLSIPKTTVSAKRWLTQNAGQYMPGVDYGKVRTEIVSKIDIEYVKSPNFLEFKSELENLFIPEVKFSARVKEGRTSKKVRQQMYREGKRHPRMPKDKRRG